MIKSTKDLPLPVWLIRLLLFCAGIEQNPGPWTCAVCKKVSSDRLIAVECSKCENWLHVKCSKLKRATDRRKTHIWIGPCCEPTDPPSSPPQPNPPPQHHPSPQQHNPHLPQHNPAPQQSVPTLQQPNPLQQQPVPQSSSPDDPEDLNILQININGLYGKLTELLDLLNDKNIHICAIQESKLTSKSKAMKTPHYTMVRKDRGKNKGGGLVFLVHESIPFQLIPTPANLQNDQHTEELSISLPGNTNNFNIKNIYIPPVSSCTAGYTPPLEKILSTSDDSTIIVGDFNGHNNLWYSESNNDPRGEAIAEELSNTNLGILNEDLPTRVTANNNSSPDLSIVTPDLLPSCNWEILTTLSSDHLPILITIPTDTKKIPTPRRTYINFEKADWPEYTKFTEQIFESTYLYEDPNVGEKFMRETILKAASKFIPAGRIPEIIPSIPTKTARLIKIRDNIRKNNAADDRIPDINKNIDKQITDHKRNKWSKHLDNCKSGSKAYWNTIKGLNNNPVQPNNQGIHFGTKYTNDPGKLSDFFNTQYTPPCNDQNSQQFRNTLRNIKKISSSTNKVKITISQVQKAIKKSKNSKALGPDEISPIMLKHLGPHGLKHLTNLFNYVVNTATIPALWKVARIIPLLKPGKPADKGSSFRPISLLSPLAKILEAVLLPTISDSIDLATHQHGFRKSRSTTTALQNIANKVTKGLNQKKPVDRTVAVAIDLSKAFDTVSHEILITEILSLDLNDYVKRFLASYLRGRKTYVEFRGHRSSCRKLKQGVPQGGVLSPLLFNLYMRDMPSPPEGIELTTYADDGTTLKSGTDIDSICKDLNEYLSILCNWFKTKNLQISASKSSATLFTTFRGEMNKVLNIKIDGNDVPTVTDPKILGVTLDPLFQFHNHAKNLKTKLQGRNKILKALAGSTWGKDKETLSSTYKAIGQSSLNYCAPIWTPNLSRSNWDDLQRCQNEALRTILGNVKKTPIDHLHAESKIMPVKEHCQMLSKQFLLQTQLPNHPNSSDLNYTKPPRTMKRTLLTEYGTEISNMIPEEGLNSDNYKANLKHIHTESVRAVIANQANSIVLDEPAPSIDISERELPRRTRTILSQLRSSYSSHLKTFLHSIGASDNPNCPDCNTELHTTNHLFNCTSKPTDLTARSLWNHPVRAARFLGLDVFDPGGRIEDEDE